MGGARVRNQKRLTPGGEKRDKNTENAVATLIDAIYKTKFNSLKAIRKCNSFPVQLN